MILVDFSPLIVSNFMGVVRNSNNDHHMEHEDLIRNLILINLKDINRRFKYEFGEMVIAVDSKFYWRRDIFPYYKAKRKEQRDKDLVKNGINWKDIKSILEKIKGELIEFSPYKIIEVDRAEADDVIGVLTKDCIKRGEKVLIVSRDKDFQQLRENDNGLVMQWNKQDDIFIEVEDLDNFIFEHVLRGDSSDGIPNILSPPDCFINKIRQTPLTKKKISSLLENMDELSENPRYEMNSRLILFDFIPEDIQTKIRDSFSSYKKNHKEKLSEYFIKHRLTRLHEEIMDF